MPADRETFPPINVTINKIAEQEPGLILFSPRRARVGDMRFGMAFGMLLIVDHAGEALWYYRAESRISESKIPKGIERIVADLSETRSAT